MKFISLIIFQICRFNEIKCAFLLMKFLMKFHTSALHIAVEKENIELIKLLIENKRFDVNQLNVLFF